MINLPVNLKSLSGCELHALIEEIGVKNVTLIVSSDELLANYTDLQILDELTSNNNRCHRLFIEELVASNIAIDNPEYESQMTKLRDFLDSVGV